MIGLMNTTLYFYSHLDLEELEVLLEKHKAWLDDELHLLYDCVEEGEEGEKKCQKIDHWSEELGAPEVHPIHDELSFDDLSFDQDAIDIEAQKQFFAGCRSSLTWQHLADLHTNPLQVTALKHFCELHPEILVDGDLDGALYFGAEYRSKLTTQFKDSKDLIVPKTNQVKKPVMKIVMDDNPLSLRLKKIAEFLDDLTPERKREMKEKLMLQSSKLDLLFDGLEKKLGPEELRTYSQLLPKAYTDGIEKIYLFLKEDKNLSL